MRKHRIFYRYVRHPLNHSQFIGTICLVQYEDGDFTHSFSQCHPTDQFSKKIGRSIALNRALNNFMPKEVGTKIFREDGTKFKKYPITNEIVNMVLDAERHARRVAMA